MVVSSVSAVFVEVSQSARFVMAALATPLVASLSNLSDVGILEPPPTAAETAAKGLRKLCESVSSSEASEAQAQVGRTVHAALMDEAADDGHAPATVLCTAMVAATRAIDTID